MSGSPAHAWRSPKMLTTMNPPGRSRSRARAHSRANASGGRYESTYAEYRRSNGGRSTSSAGAVTVVSRSRASSGTRGSRTSAAAGALSIAVTRHPASSRCIVSVPSPNPTSTAVPGPAPAASIAAQPRRNSGRGSRPSV